MDVRVFVRDKTKIPENVRDKVDTIIGDVTNDKDVSKAVAGRDAVVVALGTRNDLSKNHIIIIKLIINIRFAYSHKHKNPLDIIQNKYYF